MRPVIVFWVFYVIVMMALVLSVGCNETYAEEAGLPEIPLKNVSEIIGHIHETSICGGVTVKKPLFLIEGAVTGDPKINTTVYLYLAPRTDLDSALEIVENCMAIGKCQINSTNRFKFGPLPVGSYILRVSAYQFGEVRGFPMIREYNASNHSVEIVFHGGNYRHSLSVFSIVPMDGER